VADEGAHGFAGLGHQGAVPGREALQVFAEQADGRIGGYLGSWLVHALFLDEDAAGQDDGLGALTGGSQGAVHQQLIETEFVETELHEYGAGGPFATR